MRVSHWVILVVLLVFGGILYCGEAQPRPIETAHLSGKEPAKQAGPQAKSEPKKKVRIRDTGFVIEHKRPNSKPLRYLTLYNDRIAYCLKTDGSRVGLDRPTKSNWYNNRIFELRVNGQSIYALPLLRPEDPAGMNPVAIRLLEADDRAMVCLEWDTPYAKVGAKMTLLDGDDKLLLTLRLVRKEGYRNFDLRFPNYPSSYNRKAKSATMKLRRAVITPVRTVEQGKTVTLAAAEPWIFFFDRNYDPARTDWPVGTPEHLKSEGGSSMVYDPSEWRQVRVVVGGYSITTTFSPMPEQDVFHFALWEFKDVPNAAVLDYMRNLIVEPAKGSVQSLPPCRAKGEK